jgi:hypothetical protein
MRRSNALQVAETFNKVSASRGWLASYNVRMNSKPLRFLSVAALLAPTCALTLLACSSDDPTAVPLADAGADAPSMLADGSPPAPDARAPDSDAGSDARTDAEPDAGSRCKKIVPTFVSLNPGNGAAITVRARAGVALPNLAETEVAFELYPNEQANTYPAAGVYDVSQAPHNSYGTCELCTIVVGFADGRVPKRVFAQVAGSVNIIERSLPDATFAAVADLKNIRFEEFTQKADESWERIPNSECFELDSWQINTTPRDGKACEKVEDCPNTTRQVCDPLTAKCVAAQCNVTGEGELCAQGEVCRGQLEEEESAGACYKTCVPGGTPGCGAGQVCVPGNPTGTRGVCKGTGSIAVGALARNLTSPPAAWQARSASTMAMAGKRLASQFVTTSQAIQAVALAAFVTSAGGVFSRTLVCLPLSALRARTTLRYSASALRTASALPGFAFNPSLMCP